MWTPEEARRKIAALFAKAKGAGTAQEAMAFAEKARQLARQYGVDPADLDPDRIGHTTRRDGRRSVRAWLVMLAQAAARLNDCDILWRDQIEIARGE